MLRLTLKILLFSALGISSIKGFGQDRNSFQDSALKVIPPVWDLASCLQYAKINNLQIRGLILDKKVP